MTTPTRLPPNEPKTAFEDEAKGEAVRPEPAIPSRAAAVLEPDPALSLEPKPVESPRDPLDPPEAGEDAPPKRGTFHSLVELIHDLAIAVVVCVLLHR